MSINHLVRKIKVPVAAHVWVDGGTRPAATASPIPMGNMARRDRRGQRGPLQNGRVTTTKTSKQLKF